MKKTIIAVIAAAFALPALAQEEPKDFIIKGKPDYRIEKQRKHFERLTVKTAQPESAECAETTYEGNRVLTEYRCTLPEKDAPSTLEHFRYYVAAVEKLGGKVLWTNSREDELHASFVRNDKQYYMVVKFASYGAGAEVFIIEPSKLEFDVEILDPAAFQEGKGKDFIIKGKPDYKIHLQKKQFERLKVKSAQPESAECAETTHEGNRVYTEYRCNFEEKDAPSTLEHFRYYLAAVEKLGGKVLWTNSREDELHASFTRDGRQYYMVVEFGSYGVGANVSIIEPAKLDFDVEIIDADTILHKLDKEGKITLYINFDSGKSVIKDESKEIIEEIVTALKGKPDLKVKLEGHTDNVGNAAANKKLSDDRAKAVMEAIVAKGVDKERLSAEGFGLEKPIADNDTEAGRAKNRRVELLKQ